MKKYKNDRKNIEMEIPDIPMKKKEITELEKHAYCCLAEEAFERIRQSFEEADEEKVLQKYVDWFLPPSKFMMDTCVKGGYSPEKFRVLCNFIDVTKLPEVSAQTLIKEDYYVYLGRVNEVKGVRTLCKAAAQLDKKLIVIGDGELLPELKETYKNCSHIEFKGLMQWEEFMPILQKARMMVLPAEWSENNPLEVLSHR